MIIIDNDMEGYNRMGKQVGKARRQWEQNLSLKVGISTLFRFSHIGTSVAKLVLFYHGLPLFRIFFPPPDIFGQSF